MFKKLSIFIIFLLLIGCAENQSIVNLISEREANEIIVFLASHGIEAQKIQAATTEMIGGQAPTNLWNIMVDPDDAIRAMSLLNQQGLPRRKGATLLELFAKEGLMSSDKEENIRYQAGIEEELKNIIRKIDGILDADVQISFPTSEPLPGAEPQKIKAAVYVKHQGVLDDPNNHLETKIKRLVSGSIENLDFDNVSVIPDKSTISTISLTEEKDEIAKKARGKEYVSIWSIIMTKNSAPKFRMIFFSLIILIIVLGSITTYLLFKYYSTTSKK